MQEGESTGEGEEKVEGADVLQGELEQERKRNAELMTRLKYAQADLENYRKRMDKELKDAGESLAKSLISRLLVVQDELDLALRHVEEQTANGELMEGIRMVQGNLRGALHSAGVEKIDCVGKPFDPSVHEAVARVQGESPGLDMVIEEVRPGFTFRGQLLRPAMVKVELGSKPAKLEVEGE